MLSCDLPDIQIFTDQASVDFQLLAANAVLLEGTYYAHNGTATIGDIASIIEPYMEGDPENALTQFRIVANTDADGEVSVDFTVLYCAHELGLYDFPDWAKENFLTLCPVQRIAPDGFISLSWYTTEREGISFLVYTTYLDSDGNRGTYRYVQSGNGLIAHFNGIKTELVFLRDVVATLKERLKIESLTLQSVTLRCGNRSATFFVDPMLSGIVPFYYLNNFGQVEQLAVPTVTTEKVKSDRSIASLSKTSQFYDITTSKEYEVETGGLTSDECAQAEQMLTSPCVRVPFGHDAVAYETDFFAQTEILITDFTSEISNGDEKLNSVKFTWRFADNRPKTVAPYTPGIFNDKFQPPFS